MPNYVLKCLACEHKWERFSKVSERLDCSCPLCNGQPVIDIAAQGVPGVGNPEFHGQKAVSLMEGFHPTEVNDARRSMPAVGHCIRDDGSVKFRDREEQKKYAKAKATAGL